MAYSLFHLVGLWVMGWGITRGLICCDLFCSCYRGVSGLWELFVLDFFVGVWCAGRALRHDPILIMLLYRSLRYFLSRTWLVLSFSYY